MSFEDVEERDGVYSVQTLPGGLISCFFFRHSAILERLALISH